MTMETELNTGRNFVRCRLPWLAAAAALVFYLCTLNQWISSHNMAQVAKVSGYSWQSEVSGPLYYAVSSPLRLLPPRWVPLGVNVLSALCAALTLGLLARSVTLLPHDRTNAQRKQRRSDDALLSVPLAWLPPLLAVLACGLQLTFWECGTNGTPEMVNLLCIAYTVRALLEYRLDEREAWLYKAALVYGAVMTSDWVVIGLFPVFVVALIWIRGLSFFNLRFLQRMLLFGLIGCSLYLLLPLLASLSSIEPVGFGTALKANLLNQKSLVVMFPRKVFVLMALTSLLPVLVLSIRSELQFGDTSPLGVSLATAVYHIVHALFLVACLWVMLDPAFSPRFKGFGLPFLGLYYLSALSVGYFSGYFLLVFRPLVLRGRRTPFLVQLSHRAAIAVVILLAVATPAALLIKNLPTIRNTNHSALTDLTQLATEQLPRSGYVLSDDRRRTLMIHTWLARLGREKDIVALETDSLLQGAPAYHRYLRQEYGEKWPISVAATNNMAFDKAFTLDLLNRLSKSGGLHYLHPSFGVFFEYFYPEPHGLVYQLQPYATNALVPPPLAPQVVAENEAFWERIEREIFPSILAVTQPPSPQAQPGLRKLLLKRLHLPEEPGGDTRLAGMLYSRSINYWGVELQKLGEFEKAAGRFSLAQDLNPENVIARINLEYNKKFRAGQRAPVEMPKTFEDRFGGSSDRAINLYGPYDEPNLCSAQAVALGRGNLLRQAAQAFERVQALAPDDVFSLLGIGQINLLASKPERTLELTRDILDNPQRFGLSASNRTDALCLQAKAHFQLRDPERAGALLEAAIQAAPSDNYLLANVANVYFEQERYSNALVNLDRQLKLNPQDPAALLNKGFVYMRINEFDNAIRTMTELITITNKPDAVFFRAIAYLGTDRLDDAEKDYEALLKLAPAAHQIYYGLGEIAFRRKDTNTAISHYQAYLRSSRSNSIPDSPETRFVATRLQELQGGHPPKR